MMGRRVKTVLAFLLLLLPALASVPHAGLAAVKAAPETFSDPAMESRARHLQRQLRCLICQGESIDESNSSFAVDVRRLLREQVAEGKSDQEVLGFFVARYGDAILMKPPLQADTWLLWLAPLVVLGVAGAVAWTTVKKASLAEG